MQRMVSFTPKDAARLVKSQSEPPFLVTQTSFGPLLGMLLSDVMATKLGVSGAMATWYTCLPAVHAGFRASADHLDNDQNRPLVFDHLKRVVGPNAKFG